MWGVGLEFLIEKDSFIRFKWIGVVFWIKYFLDDLGDVFIFLRCLIYWNEIMFSLFLVWIFYCLNFGGY